MRLLLTGACGQIGRHAVQHALASGYDVRIFDLGIPVNKEIHAKHFPQVEAVWGDITAYDDCLTATRDIDACVHLCALIPFAAHTGQHAERNKELAYKVNVEGTRNMLRAMEASHAGKEATTRFVFASSGAVYGVSDAVRRVGNTLNPGNDEYAQHKVEGETLVQASNLNWTILRICCGVTGEPKKPFVATPETLSYRALKTMVEFGHVEDISLAFVKSVACAGCEHKILNLGGGPAMQTTHGDYVRMNCEKAGIPMPDASIFPEKGQGAWADSEESQRLLQYQRHTLKDLM